ncbi:ABC transporter substrate-binding protein [Paenibacillus ehimensis]|uniref:ABC transporter substrate-binding protein n=1 Tax=Paenibacillus ehimensis TaxID=79264 RepID=UPI000FDA1086|nr:ABC transporter substrate-binding protein [Paenibacillus ehimensis]
MLLGIVAGLACTATGCTWVSDTKEQPKLSGSIKVVYWNKNSFMQNYGNLFSVKYPDLTVEVLPLEGLYKPQQDNKKAFDDYVQLHNPDVLLLDSEQFERYAGSGKLKALDADMKKDAFDTKGYYSGVLEYLRRAGDGKIYGFAPFFNCEAVFYNKKLFAEHGVPFPGNKMSWNELILLSQRFSTQNEDPPVYGLEGRTLTNPFIFATTVGASYGLKYLDPESKKMTLNTPEWAKVFKLVAEAFQKGNFYKADPASGPKPSPGSKREEVLKQQYPFLNGHIAMTIQGVDFVDVLSTTPGLPFEWDLVTVPVDQSNPNSGNSMSVNEIFSVNVNSQNPAASWKFIEYINSDAFARIMTKSTIKALPARVNAAPKEERNVKAFYELTPPNESMYKNFDKLPDSFLMTFDSIINQEMEPLLQGKSTAETALQRIEARSQAELDKPKDENPGSEKLVLEISCESGEGDLHEVSGFQRRGNAGSNRSVLRGAYGIA